MEGNSLIRTFLALPVHEEFSAELKTYLAQLQRVVPEAKWVPPEQIHITLHFFGDVPAGDIPKVKRLVRPLAAACPSLKLSLNPLGFFPDARKARVIWAGVTGDEAGLVKLQQQIEAVLSGAGYPAEKRDFKPHATLGRSRSVPLSLSALKFPEIKTSEKVFNHIVLYKSTLGPRASIYEILETFPLS